MPRDETSSGINSRGGCIEGLFASFRPSVMKDGGPESLAVVGPGLPLRCDRGDPPYTLASVVGTAPFVGTILPSNQTDSDGKCRWWPDSVRCPSTHREVCVARASRGLTLRSRDMSRERPIGLAWGDWGDIVRCSRLGGGSLPLPSMVLSPLVVLLVLGGVPLLSELMPTLLDSDSFGRFDTPLSETQRVKLRLVVTRKGRRRKGPDNGKRSRDNGRGRTLRVRGMLRLKVL